MPKPTATEAIAYAENHFAENDYGFTCTIKNVTDSSQDEDALDVWFTDSSQDDTLACMTVWYETRGGKTFLYGEW